MTSFDPRCTHQAAQEQCSIHATQVKLLVADSQHAFDGTLHNFAFVSISVPPQRKHFQPSLQLVRT